MLFEITGQMVLRNRCGPEALKDAGEVAGLGALALLEIRFRITRNTRKRDSLLRVRGDMESSRRNREEGEAQNRPEQASQKRLR